MVTALAEAGKRQTCTYDDDGDYGKHSKKPRSSRREPENRSSSRTSRRPPQRYDEYDSNDDSSESESEDSDEDDSGSETETETKPQRTVRLHVVGIFNILFKYIVEICEYLVNK